MNDGAVRAQTAEEILTLYVIFRHPTDYPGKWVVRRQYIDRDMKPDQEPHTDAVPLAVADTLGGARAAIPKGMYNMGRTPGDVPAIYEVWL